MDIQADLAKHLDQFAAAPFLFVGSGISRRYMNLETWKDLLQRFAEPLSKDFGYYASQVNNDLSALASLLADPFHEIWWNTDRYAASRDQFRDTATKKDSPFKIEIAQYIRQATPVADNAKLIEEMRLIKEASVDGIITTNWDLLLEGLFPSFQVFKGQEQLLFSHHHSIAEIYKIHGCCTEPNSLVLTREDYEDFNARNPYLAAKLLTIFLEHPIIFLGYSLSDPNIITILHAIVSCLRGENLEKLRNNLVFVQRDQGDEQFSSTVVSLESEKTVLPVTIVKTDDFSKVFKPIAQNRRKFPAKVLRKLKEHVYELVKTNDPKGQMHVIDIENEDDTSKIQIVYGVGVAAQIGQIWYAPIKIDELLEDVVLDLKRFNAEQIILRTLPEFLKLSQYVPVFRYLRQAGYFDKGKNGVKNLPPSVQQAMKATPDKFAPQQSYLKKKDSVRGHNCGAKGLLEHYNRDHCLIYAHLLDYSKNGLVDELGVFLKENFADCIKVKGKGTRTYLRKLVCLYDFLKSGPAA